jgi:hypothetical protein
MAAPHSRLTDGQIAYFKCNRRVRSVGRSFACFSDEFKERFWRMRSEENLLPQEMLPRLGADCKMPGRKRAGGIAQSIKKKCASGIAEGKRRRRQAGLGNERRLFRLRAGIEHLRQENDFLKKMVSADREARRWARLRERNSE